jgi:hypothetical protein
MLELPRKKFSSPDEEIAYLRDQLAARHRESGPPTESAQEDYDPVIDTMTAYQELPSGKVLARGAALTPERAKEHAVTVTSDAEAILATARDHGVKNALSVIAQVEDPRTRDDAHRLLIEEIRNGMAVTDLKEGAPAWQALHMSLFSVMLPEHKTEGEVSELATLLSAMEQFYAGMQAIARGGKPTHYALEIAVAEGSDEIIFYVAVPTSSATLFEKQILSLFPRAIVTLARNDYNIFTPEGFSVASTASLAEAPIYPIRTYDEFSTDPLNVILNAFSKIDRAGGAAVQLVIEAGGKSYYETYEGIIKHVREGMKPKEAIRRSTLPGELFAGIKETIFQKKKKEDEKPKETDHEAIELFTQKIARPVVPVNIRVVAAGHTEADAVAILGDIEAGFNQFERADGNRFTFTRAKGSAEKKLVKAFIFREFDRSASLPLSFSELATVMHVPEEGVAAAPQFKQSRAAGAPAPLDLPREGTLLGVNHYRGTDTDAYITAEDRLRHFYIIGQTGTGKTTLMKNMIAQDIARGDGVCFIDPHGTDIADVLASVPESRRDDVIYFDPSRTDYVIGLNMLEFDPAHPEQKTFVVNELFSIFQKLYGAVPESMGPMFEQYFRNATLLVLEDPESGSTLLDISRVMADAAFRKEKLAHARNPVVVQFWNEIATKAGGEAALENIVPYITSKFDIFTANDYIRPIVGQQRSSFNMRTVMDERKILLVNLAKGRLGEINANLIGMILVGKILMAALSRVDDERRAYAPFYLHMDEFQNVMTDSIASILSEARKYKLGLTLAHQYIAQLDENIRDAVFGNVGSVAAFRVGSEDAAFLEHQFEPVFKASDLMNIENYHAYVRILANGTPTKPFDIATVTPPETDRTTLSAIIERSIMEHGEPRRKIEMDIRARYHA